MKSRFFPFFIGAVVLFAVVLIAQKWFPVQGMPRPLYIYTNSSFAAQWGPGPKLAALFEKHCLCKVVYLEVAEGGLLLQRLALDKGHDRADMVVGLDQLHMPEARKKFQWRPLQLEGVEWSERFPQQLIFSDFVPFDWAPLTFIYRTQDEGWTPPSSLDDLLSPTYHQQIALEDPRSSTTGLQFLYWVLSVKGVEEGFRFLERLKPNIQSVSPSWSTAYGLFKKDQARFVFSYVTSPLYHWQEEQDFSYQGLSFPEGHIYQLEYAGVLKTCRECFLAQDFTRFLLEPEAQAILVKTNYILPVIRALDHEPLLTRLPSLKLLPFDKLGDLSVRKDELLERWSRLGY